MRNLGENWPDSAKDWLTRADRPVIRAVDSHTGGNPTRIILDGVDLPQTARTVDTARAWLKNEADWVRTRLVHEPRGGGLTCAVLPVATDEDGCDIGAVILEPGSYPPMCGHCMIGFASVIVELKLLPDLWRTDPQVTSFRIRTPAGPVGVTARRTGGKLTSVTLTNVASFVVGRGTTRIGGRSLPTELLYGGDYYITCDADEIGLSLDRSNATEIVALARELRTAFVENGVVDPLTGETLDVYQVLFFRRLPGEDKRAKIVVVAPPGVIDRSPCGTGSSALFAKFVSSGEMGDGETLTTESIVGSTFSVSAKDVVAGTARKLVTPLLTGQAHINGFLVIAADTDDAFGDGFPPL